MPLRASYRRAHPSGWEQPTARTIRHSPAPILSSPIHIFRRLCHRGEVRGRERPPLLESRHRAPRRVSHQRRERVSREPDQPGGTAHRSEEHTELQSRLHLVCRLLLEKKKKTKPRATPATSCTLVASAPLARLNPC